MGSEWVYETFLYVPNDFAVSLKPLQKIKVKKICRLNNTKYLLAFTHIEYIIIYIYLFPSIYTHIYIYIQTYYIYLCIDKTLAE